MPDTVTFTDPNGDGTADRARDCRSPPTSRTLRSA